LRYLIGWEWRAAAEVLREGTAEREGGDRGDSARRATCQWGGATDGHVAQPNPGARWCRSLHYLL